MVPHGSDEQTLNSTVKKVVEIPLALKNTNMVIEILGHGKQEFKTFYSNQLKVTISESYGELKVTHSVTNKPLPRVYVKVFSQTKSGGKEVFFRDGYTDITGKFEYSQTSGDKLKDAKKFAILIQSDKFGSKI